MKLFKSITLGFLVLLFAASAQAGFLTAGLESQLSGLNGDDTIKVLVVMSDQADIASLDMELHNSKATMAVRHSTVLNILHEQAARSQGNLLASLEANKANGSILGYASHWLVNSVVVTGTVDAIRELAARPDVERVEANLVVELIEPMPSAKVVDTDRGNRGIGMTPGVAAINAPRVWRELGIDGTGTIIGGIDTGADGNHPALAARWQGNFAPASESWLDVLGGGTSFPTDTHGHGTHTMGTMTGLAADDTIGVAPGAHWIATNAINQGASGDFDNDIIVSFEFMADPDGNPATLADVPCVVQNSWGVNEGFSGYFDCDSRWWDAIDNCEAAGVVVTWAAGNEGPGGTSLRSPADRADSPTNCFSVGSTIANPPYTISSYSSRGPSGCGGVYAMKPEISAPGEDIYSASPGGGYQYMSGTSMACPHMAGVVSLMRASNPNVDVITIKEIIMATATDLGPVGEDNTYGHGFIDAYAAVLGVMGGIGSVEGVITDSGTGLPISGVLVQKVGGYNMDTTDANGYFSMTMPIGEVELAASKFGYYGTSVATTILEDQVVSADMVMNLLPSSTVSGTVFGPDGNTVAGAVVRASNTPLDPVNTDASGYYSIVLPSGAGQVYDMVARANGMGTQAQTIELLGDLTLDFNLPEWIGDDFESGNLNRFPWEMSGTTGWVIDSTNAYEGAYCATSGNISDSQSSTMSLTLDVLAAGDLKFWYKVSSEANYDYLQFLVDGNLVAEWDGEVNWTEFVYAATPGTHTFSFTYDKDGSVSTGGDAGWIDFMELPAVDLPGVPAISVDTTPIEVSLGTNTILDMPFAIGNVGDGTLNFALNLVEVGAPRIAVVNPVPDADFGKGEKDDRAPVSPITGAGGPDAFGYSWIDSDEAGGPVYGWIDISGDGNVVGTGDDANFGPFAMEFPFSYYGDVFNSVQVCTNGWVSFTSTSTSYSNAGIPNSAEPNNLLAAFWDDLNPSSGGTIYYRSEPNRFIVQFQDVPHYGGGLPVTFQVILNSNGSIVYQYELIQDISGSTVGIENGAGDDGLLVCFNDGSYLHNGLAIQFASVPPMTWFTAAPLVGIVMEGSSEEVTLHFDANGLSDGLYQATLNIASNDPENANITIPVFMIVGAVGIVNPIGDEVEQDNTPALKTALVGAFPNPFNPMTTVKFSLERDQKVKLLVYDVSGRLVSELADKLYIAGEHSVVWQGRDSSGRAVSSGNYFLYMVTEQGVHTSKMTLVR